MTQTLPLPPLQVEATAGLATDFGIIHCRLVEVVHAPCIEYIFD